MILQAQEPALLLLPSLGTDGGQEQVPRETEVFRNILAQLQTALTPPPPAEGQEQLATTPMALGSSQQPLLTTLVGDTEAGQERRPATPPAQEKREQQALESILHTIQEIFPTIAMPLPLPPLPVAGVQGAIPQASVPVLSPSQQVKSVAPQASLSRPLNSAPTPATAPTLPAAPLQEAGQMSSAPCEGVFSAVEPQSAPATSGTAKPTATIPSTSFPPNSVRHNSCQEGVRRS
jgi:hypothetical protein